jgi:transposase-like protein
VGHADGHDRAGDPEGPARDDFPSLLQPRRRAEHALLAVVQEAYVHGVSTRKVDDLVKALGVEGISKSEVSHICGELDTVVAAFRTRPLTGEHRYL